MAKNTGVRVYCKTLKKWFRSIKDADKFAKVNDWTMSKKMTTAGSFVDFDGNEYVRLEPMKSKNIYNNTGTTLKKIIKRHKKVKTEQIEKVDDFVFGDLPVPVQQLIEKTILDMLEANKPWVDVKNFMRSMGCKQLTIRIVDDAK